MSTYISIEDEFLMNIELLRPHCDHAQIKPAAVGLTIGSCILSLEAAVHRLCDILEQPKAKPKGKVDTSK